MPLLTSFIDGRYVPERADAERFETIDPATGEVLAEVQAATDADIHDAVASAQRGQKAWAALTPVERARILNRAVELLRASARVVDKPDHVGQVASIEETSLLADWVLEEGARIVEIDGDPAVLTWPIGSAARHRKVLASED